MSKLLIKLSRPYLSPEQADEIRAEGFRLNPKLCFVVAGWPWLEMRGLTALRERAFLEGLETRGVRFVVLEEGKRKKVKVGA